jgi:N-succinyldiaminopimelate aminotransferase
MAARLRRFNGPSIFSEMTVLAQQCGAVNLGQGFPDSDGPPAMLAAAARAMADGRNQYPPSIGVPELRQQIAARRSADHGTDYDPDREIVVTAGATEAIAAAVIGLCDPGDEVVAFDPVFDSYTATVAMAGARIRSVLLSYDGQRFTFDPDELRRAITPRTKVLLLNSPHNPTGKVFDAEELMLIAELCCRHGLTAVTDEVYEYLVYDGRRHIPLASLPGMRERTLTMSSAGKSFSATGWKIGWACGPAELVSIVHAVKQFLTFATGTPMQYAVAAALRDEREWVTGLQASLQSRRDLLLDGLTALGIDGYCSEGTYFAQMDARSLGYTDGVALCRALAVEAGVVGVPSVALYDHKDAGAHLIRLAFCKNEQTLTTALDRLSNYVARTGRGAAVSPSG